MERLKTILAIACFIATILISEHQISVPGLQTTKTVHHNFQNGTMDTTTSIYNYQPSALSPSE
ncbi:MAG: hypothetical protein P8100_00795 [bacterium]